MVGKKRKAATAPVAEPTSAEKRLKAIEYDEEQEQKSGFSDYNPFQSGAEETPEKSKRRRKVRSLSFVHLPLAR